MCVVVVEVGCRSSRGCKRMSEWVGGRENAGCTCLRFYSHGGSHGPLSFIAVEETRGAVDPNSTLVCTRCRPAPTAQPRRLPNKQRHRMCVHGPHAMPPPSPGGRFVAGCHSHLSVGREAHEMLLDHGAVRVPPILHVPISVAVHLVEGRVEGHVFLHAAGRDMPDKHGAQEHLHGCVEERRRVRGLLDVSWSSTTRGKPIC